MKSVDWTSESLNDLPAIAAELLEDFSDDRIFLFVGKMGAGKTTFVKELASSLGSQDDISSPTFSLVNEYKTSDGICYHFDFYRIEREEEAYDMGFEEYLDSGNYCFIEWPDRVERLLPERFVLVRIEELEGKRDIVATQVS